MIVMMPNVMTYNILLKICRLFVPVCLTKICGLTLQYLCQCRLHLLQELVAYTLLPNMIIRRRLVSACEWYQ